MPTILRNASGKLVRNVSGKLAIADHATFDLCCCGCDSGWCDCEELRYDAVFSGAMDDDYSGTYTSIRKDVYAEEGCQYVFGDDSPIGTVTYDALSGDITIRAHGVPGYGNYGDATIKPACWPIILYDPWMLEWANGWPPTEYWADYLKLYCADEGEVVAPGPGGVDWTQIQ